MEENKNIIKILTFLIFKESFPNFSNENFVKIKNILLQDNSKDGSFAFKELIDFLIPNEEWSRSLQDFNFQNECRMIFGKFNHFYGL